MAKITRIKASDPGPSPEKAKKAEKTVVKAKVDSQGGKKARGAKKASHEAVKEAKKAVSSEKAVRKPFILIRPFVYFGRYVRESFMELRQVRWPSRKATWKLVLAIFVYTALFIAIIMLLDALFTWLFGLIIG